MEIAIGKRERIGQVHARVSYFEISPSFEGENAVMARPSHEHDFRCGERKVDTGFLLHDGEELAQFPPTVAFNISAIDYDLALPT